jgi:hypothetical protein
VFLFFHIENSAFGKKLLKKRAGKISQLLSNVKIMREKKIPSNDIIKEENIS